MQVSYPGVYIQEVPSGVRTITGVATSMTAFVGGAVRGPVDDPVLITSYAEFERRFGGLDVKTTMSYAVRDYYANGGSQALIVRVTNGAGPATIALGDGSPAWLTLVAANPGKWGERLEAAIHYAPEPPEAAASPASVGSPAPTEFNLTVRFRLSEDETVTERFLGLSADPDHRRFAGRVLERSSALVRVQSDPASQILPAETSWVRAQGGSDGLKLDANAVIGQEGPKTGIYALERADLFNLLCIPPPVRGEDGDISAIYGKALALCVKRRAMLIVDPPRSWASSIDRAVQTAIDSRDSLGIAGNAARNAALYFPWVQQADPLREGQLDFFPPCGIVAGIMARTDGNRGVWKAPAGLDASLNGVSGLQTRLNDLENGRLNQLGINCLRSFPVHGRVVWGARTMRGADQSADEYKYVPVRRLALFLEESLYRGTQWVVFEPNDEPLWGQIRLAVGAFMHRLFRQGAFQGQSAREAYLVKCDAETTTQDDINLGIVNILVGFAPLKPAEFVIVKIQQLAGQVQS